MCVKLLVRRELKFILRICEETMSVIVRLEILLWLSGPEKFPGLSKNGPLGGGRREEGLLGACSQARRDMNKHDVQIPLRI